MPRWFLLMLAAIGFGRCRRSRRNPSPFPPGHASSSSRWRSRPCRSARSAGRLARKPAPNPGRRPERPPRRVLERHPEQLLDRRHRRGLEARPLLARRHGAARRSCSTTPPSRPRFSAYVDDILAHQQPDGWLGPIGDTAEAQAVRCLAAVPAVQGATQYQEATGDPRVIPALLKCARKIDEVIAKEKL